MKERMELQEEISTITKNSLLKEKITSYEIRTKRKKSMELQHLMD